MDKEDDVEKPSSYYIPANISMLISTRQSMSPEIDPPPPHTTTTTMISVPFKWEESPGKPRHCDNQPELGGNTKTTTTLELPPRLLLLEANKVAPSPTTVYLDNGPLLGRAISFTTSYRTPREKWNSNFGSSRRNGFRNQVEEDTFDFSGHNNIANNTSKARSSSLLSLSKAKSHLWASIYESFKQVVPWRRKKETLKKWPSK